MPTTGTVTTPTGTADGVGLRGGTEPLIFEKSSPGNCAVSLPDSDVPAVEPASAIPADLLADAPPPLPEIGELQLVRHFTRLSHRLFSVDTQFYPLGSCTMKYNPRINEHAAALPGFAGLHPLAPDAMSQGALRLLFELRTWLAEVAGLDEVSLQPCAGAHGEMTGLMVIIACHRSRGQNGRTKVLTPDSSHGTNPASCTLCGRHAVPVKSNARGRVDLDDLRAKVDDETAAMMITNPSTLGLFEDQIAAIAEILHDAGAMLYLDGANMNAIMGLTRPGDFGVDVMHFNTHKTFSTPHGGGGPGAGPIAVRKHLAPFLPAPQVVKKADGTFAWDFDRPQSIGRVRSFNGQFGVLVRAWTYIRALGNSGLRQASETAVLAANYLAARLKDAYDLPYALPCMHEFVLSAVRQKARGVTGMDVAKRLIDYDIHPPTTYFPMIVPEALMIEPTETESLAVLDRFVEVMLRIAAEAESDPDALHAAPTRGYIRRADVVAGDRKPNLRWEAE
ncbi:MAG: putative glycine dehydrogenase (decarboxylating) subunit 2 [Phycisphaerae bacterium]|nr:putative glycine dehydrogenase (decarboxylating) subunit 2 [Phycisphaerae bacterium]